MTADGRQRTDKSVSSSVVCRPSPVVCSPEEERYAERSAFGTSVPRLQDADPHPVWILAADRRSAHCGRDDSRKLFGDLHRLGRRASPVQLVSLLCATKLTRWGSSGATPAFRDCRPRWQASGCSFAST